MSKPKRSTGYRAVLARKLRDWLGVRKLRYSLLAVVGILLLAYFSFGNYGFLKIANLFAEKKALEGELREAKSQQDSLFQLRQKITENDAFFEKLAREKLGMAGKDETVFIFADEPEEEKSVAPGK